MLTRDPKGASPDAFDHDASVPFEAAATKVAKNRRYGNVGSEHTERAAELDPQREDDNVLTCAFINGLEGKKRSITFVES